MVGLTWDGGVLLGLKCSVWWKAHKNETQRPTNSRDRNGNVNGRKGVGEGEGGWVPAFFSGI